MSGGIQELINLKTFNKEKLWKVLFRANKKNALMGCGILVNLEIIFWILILH